MTSTPRFPLPCALALVALLGSMACRTGPDNLEAQRNRELDQLGRQAGMTYAWQRPGPVQEAAPAPPATNIVLARLEP